MVILCPRIHFYEINDQAWFPQYLREKVQSSLTLLWQFRVWPLQRMSLAQLAAELLYKTLGRNVKDYTYVDFAAGAGGPTPFIEVGLNARIAAENHEPEPDLFTNSDGSVVKRKPPSRRQSNSGPVKFVLTDIHPHIADWTEAAKKSDNLSFISTPVDATNVPKDLMEDTGKKVFRLYNLAFHHFDDPLALEVLKNTLETADGFGIFELQSRQLSSAIMITLMGPLLLLITAFYFWHNPGHLFFSYVIPIVPCVVVIDGYTSSLRTRTPAEVEALMKKCGADSSGWTIKAGEEMHTFPIGFMTWFIATKN